MDADKDFLELVFEGDVRNVKKRLDAGQNPNVGNENGESAVHLAIKGATRRAAAAAAVSGELELLTTLVERGAFVDYSDSFQKRPIDLCMEGQEFVKPFTKFLLGLKDASNVRVLDLSAQRPDGSTLMHECAWTGNHHVAAELLNTGAFEGRLEERNEKGQTALHVASFRSSKELPELLTKAGADHTAVEQNPRSLSRDTSEIIATKSGHPETAAYLKSLNTTLAAVSFAGKLKKGKGA